MTTVCYFHCCGCYKLFVSVIPDDAKDGWLTNTPIYKENKKKFCDECGSLLTIDRITYTKAVLCA